MSRGPGRVQRAVEETFVSQPDAAFSIADLAVAAYGIEHPEKRHRVAILRGAWEVANRLNWWGRKSTIGIIFYNPLSPRSIALSSFLSLGRANVTYRMNRIGFETSLAATGRYGIEASRNAALIAGDNDAVKALTDNLCVMILRGEGE